MLSLIDLIKSQTLCLDLTAFLLEKVSQGDSFIIGAQPGGAGKTTVMCALVNCIPFDRLIFHTDGFSSIEAGKKKKPACYICHEISKGNYFAYLWGKPLQEFFKLKKYGHILATNLHADTYEQAKNQICVENQVPEQDFYNINIYAFLELKGNLFNPQRQITSIWYSEKGEKHKEIFKNNTFILKNFNLNEQYRTFLREMIKENRYLIEDFREELIKERAHG